jgi:hypothetical protein
MDKRLKALLHFFYLLFGAIVMNAGGIGLMLGAFYNVWLGFLIILLGAGILGFGVWGIIKDPKPSR